MLISIELILQAINCLFSVLFLSPSAITYRDLRKVSAILKDVSLMSIMGRGKSLTDIAQDLIGALFIFGVSTWNAEHTGSTPGQGASFSRSFHFTIF